MTETKEMFKLRVLLALMNEDSKRCNVTGIAKAFGDKKYRISRIFGELEDEGILDRTNPRKPRLTPYGRKVASEYSRRLDDNVELLLSAGVPVENAKSDAVIWALRNSANTAEVISEMAKKLRMKQLFQNEKGFSGLQLERKTSDGTYEIPFIIYCENAKYGNNLSSVNDIFLNPCNVEIRNKKGFINLESRVGAGIPDIRYLHDGVYEIAERHGRIFSIPIEAVEFISVGEGKSHIIHGSLPLLVTGSGVILSLIL